MWNSIFLPSTTSPPKDLRTKPSPLSRAIFGRCPRPPYFFSWVGVSDPRRKKRLQGFIRGAFVRAAGDWAVPINAHVYIARICRGGSITSRPYKWPTYKKTAAYSSSSGHSLQPVKERWGGLGHLPKIALLMGEGFGLKSFGGEVVEGKKMLFHTFFWSFNGWLVNT